MSFAKTNDELQEDREIAVARSKQNKLTINYDKDTYMVLGTKPKVHGTYPLDLSADRDKIEKFQNKKSFLALLLMTISYGLPT